MGILINQTIIGSIYTYIGAALATITGIVFYPWFFSSEEIGVISLLIAYSTIFSQLANLGFDSVTGRLFPYFRNKEKYHFGYGKLLLYFNALGCIIFTLVFIGYLQSIIKNEEKIVYLYFAIPIIWANVFFNSLDAYARIVCFNSTWGIFLKETFQRFLILLVILIYILFKNFDLFIVFFTVSFILPTIILANILIVRKEFFVKGKVNNEVYNGLKKEIYSVALFGILTSVSSTIISNIDKIMLQHYLGLSKTGIYTVAYYFSTVMLLIARTITKASSGIIAEAWKKNDKKTISFIYEKSSLNQLIFSMLLFLFIYSCFNEYKFFLPEIYHDIKPIIFWLLVGCIIEMSTGISNLIISTSPKYKYSTYFMIGFIFIIIITNIIFIPRFGVVGAAIASAISIFLFNFVRWLFLYKSFNLQPFSLKTFYLFILFTLFFLVLEYIPNIKNLYVTLIIKLFVIFVFLLTIFFLKISREISEKFFAYIKNPKSFFSLFNF